MRDVGHTKRDTDSSAGGAIRQKRRYAVGVCDAGDGFIERSRKCAKYRGGGDRGATVVLDGDGRLSTLLALPGGYRSPQVWPGDLITTSAFDCSRKLDWRPHHSAFSATNGSTFVALRAGR